MKNVVALTFLPWILIVSCMSDNASLSPGELYQNHIDLLVSVEDYVNRPDKFVEGEWQEHWGDGALFGPLYDLAKHRFEGVPDHYQRGIEALEANRARVLEAAPNLSAHLDNLEELSMSTLSLIESGLLVDDPEPYREAAAEMLIGLGSIAELYKDYLEIDAGDFAADSYGPTSLTAFLANVYLGYAQNYPEDNREHHLERASAILDRIHSKVWDEEQSVYLFAPGDERLMLYPNVTTMAALARAYQLTGEPRFWSRFQAAFEGVQALKDEDGDHYHSPYSRESMGATDEDYTTHSSQNYFILALMTAYEVSENRLYLEEVDAMLGFLKERLLVDGQILHHWIDGRAAAEPDPYIYCLGCNVQTLFILFRLALL